MGLMPGPVPPRVDASVKAGLLELVAYAQREGWSSRSAAAALGADHMRVLRWAARAAVGAERLVDAPSGPDEAAHALLDWERAAIVKLADEWAAIDRSHRKLAHRGSRLEMVYASESTVLRVLSAEGVYLPQRQPREPRPARPWPEWAELIPGVVWIYDFTHFSGLPGWCAIAILDVVSRKWLSTVVSPEETSTQVEVAFTRALVADGKDHLLEDPALLAELHGGTVPEDDRLPVLVAISDNGPQMTSRQTAAFLAGARIAAHHGRPGTPNDQAWIESFFGHLKDENPHLDKITDPGDLEAELARLREFYNTTRLHEGLGYVTPDDEHHGRGEALRAARRDGLKAAHATRVATRRQIRQDHP
jgi:transposase InsO family protein